jgi:hypothetical protein
MKRHRFATLTCWIAACSLTLWAMGCSPTATGSPSGAAPASGLATYRPFSATYDIRSHTLQEQEFGGQVNSVVTGLRWLLSASIRGATSPWQLTLTIDSTPEVTGIAPGLSEQDLERAAGTVFTAMLTPEGEVTDFQGGDSSSAFLQQQARSLERFFPRLPTGGVAPGQAWSDTAEVSTGAAGMDIQIEAVTESVAGTWVDHLGHRALEIRTVSHYSLVGGGSQGGTEIDVDGTGTSHGVLYLGDDGRFLGGTSADTTNMVATVAAMGAMIPILQVSTDTVALVR